MKRNTFILIVVSLLAFAGNMWADTDKLPAADGWTKITSVPTSTDIANNYYVFVDATRDLMLGIGKGVHQDTKWYSLGVYYRSSVSPTTKDINQMVWTLEAQNDGFAMRNLESPVRLFMTEWNAAWKFDTNDIFNVPNDGWTKVKFTLDDGKFTLQNGYYPSSGYIGPWDDVVEDGAECAGNKTGSSVGKFHIYAISRTQFKQNLLDNASSSNPVDLTPWYVTNPTFDGNSITGWTDEGSGNNFNYDKTGCEIWHRFKLYQNVTIPNGKYKVSVQATGSTSGTVYGTSGATTKEASATVANQDNYQNSILAMIRTRDLGRITTDEITVSNGSLTIGFKDGTNNQWDVFDNFKLYCTGVDLSAYEEQLADLVSDCNDFIDSDVVPTACENAISSAITTYNQSYETAKEYSTAIVALTNVLDTYRNDTELQSAYAAYKTMRTNVQGLKNTDTYHYTDPGSAKTTFDAAISSANTAVEAATTASAINTQTANIRAAAMTFISSVTAEDGNPFNITFLASQVYSDFKKTDGSAAGIVADQFLTNRPGDIPSFAENFEWTAATTGNVLYQTVANLPSGYYQVGMYTMALSTSQRDNIPTDATEGDSDRSFAFAGDLTDASSIKRTGMPIKFATAVDFTDLTTLDVNVHLSSAGDLTFGVQKDANGSNWHFAQIVSILYSNAPDLTQLKATRDALVSEAEGLLASSDADLLTSSQKDDLQDAIDEGYDADTFDDLNEVTLTTLPNAINTAKSQISTVKANRVLMLAALERFETDYNLTDGTDYRRLTMSAGAWTDLLTAVNNVTTAMDDVSQAASYGTLKDALIAKMDATDASLRLFKSYKAMVEGCTALEIAGSYGADGNMDTDATQQTAITALNTAYGTYAASQTNDFVVSAFLGSNLDFSAAEGTVINNDNSNNIRNVDGWEVEYADADTWAVLQTHQGDNDEKLYMRKNWGSSATTLKVIKEKMLPVGKYRLSLKWNSDMSNMTNRSSFKVGENAAITVGENSDGSEPLTYDFEVTGAATTFDLVIGFQKTGTENTPAQIIVDDVTLTALGVNNVLIKDYDPAAAEFDARGYTAASDVTLTPDQENNKNQIIYANTGQLTNTNNVVISGVCGNFVITDKMDIHTTNDFSATASTYSRTMAETTQYGTLILPFTIDVDASSVDFFTLRITDDDNMTFTPWSTSSIPANTPLLFKKKTSTATSITVNGVANDDIEAIENAPAEETQGEENWKAIGYYQGNGALDGTNTYYIAGDKFWEATGTLNMQPFRVVFKAPSGIGARSFIIDIDDTPTGIEEVDGSKVQEFKSSNWYDLNGRRLKGKPTRKGFYINDGKKVYVR